jgi:hypothetical protein
LHLITTYPAWYFLICLLAGGLAAFLLYYRDQQLRDFTKGLVAALAILRFTGVTLLVFFLLEPMLKLVFQEVEKPVLVIATDYSSSMTMTADSTKVLQFAESGLNELIASMSDEFEVRTYAFGDEVTENQPDDFTAPETDFSLLLDEVYNRYSNRNLGAVILASDGIYNRGMNPVYQSSKLSVPIYPIAFGDTTTQKDIVLKELVHNQLAYLGNDFPVEVSILGNGYSGRETEVSIAYQGNEITREPVKFNNEGEAVTLRMLINATKTGLQRYTVTVKPLEGEFTAENNQRELYIDVLDSKQKILLAAHSPHPDLRALKLAVETNENYEVTLYLPGDPMPVLEEYNLAILHGLPGANAGIQLASEIKSKKFPVWFILTAQTDIIAFNDLEPGISITNSGGSLNSAGAAFQSSFSLFNFNNEDGFHFSKLPPLQVPFGEYLTTSQGQTMMLQRIGTVNTGFPLFRFNDLNQWKTAVLAGEGIWRWRTMSYADFRSHKVFNDLIQKSVQYLSARDNKDFLRVSGARTFRENEAVTLRAEFYNQAYELFNEPEVLIDIHDEQDLVYEFSFSRTQRAYRLNAGLFPPGNYRYRAKAEDNGRTFLADGTFSVVQVNAEALSTRANHKLLFQLAANSGGSMHYPDNLSALAQEIKNNGELTSVIFERKELSDLINLRWIFFILLALFSAEWFIRKRNGAY